MTQFWIDKYKPEKLEDFVGNKTLSQILEWFQNWKPGKALLLSGGPGSGKTLSVELISKLKSLQLVRLDSNESRNKEAIENLATGSKSMPLFYSGKIILIDELEGLSGSDRGALSAIVGLIKESRFPVVLITIDPYLTKFSDLRKVCEIIKFSKIPTPSINKRLKDICKLEGIKIEEDVTKALSRFSGGDLRSAINDLEAVSKGKKEIKIEDLEVLGYRERELSVFDVLPTIFRSKNIQTTKKAIDQVDKDSDEVFWWIESNILKEFQGKELVEAYEILSKANIYRGLVMKQQNWRFKAIATDIFSAISLPNKSGGFVMYAPPQRFLQLGRTKFKREALNSICGKMKEKLHCSKNVIKREYLPYMSLLLKKSPDILEDLGLEKDDLKIFI